MDAKNTEARVCDFETREALIEAIVIETLRQEHECIVKFGEVSGVTVSTARQQTIDFLTAVDEGSQRLDRERRIYDVTLDVIDFMIDRAWELELS